MARKSNTFKNTVLDDLKSQLEFEEKKISNFKSDFDNDPLRALSWSHDVFHAAAESHVLKSVINDLKDADEGENFINKFNLVIKKLESLVVDLAGRPATNTSPTRNLHSSAVLGAHSSLLINLRQLKEYSPLKSK